MPLQKGCNQPKNTNLPSGCRELPQCSAFKSMLLGQILVETGPLETLRHSETIKVLELVLPPSSAGIRKSWLFLVKGSGQIHGHGSGLTDAHAELKLTTQGPH